MPNGPAGDKSILRAHLRPSGAVALVTNETKFGGYSLSFNGASQGNFVTDLDNASHEFGSGDFTVEMWIRPSSLPGAGAFPGIIGKRGSSTSNYAWQMYLAASTGNVTFEYSTSGSGATGSAVAGSPTVNAWSHIAAVRNGASLVVYLNGVGGSSHNIGTATIFDSSLALMLGQLSQEISANWFSGHMDSIRITKGVARYTANFTPPTSDFPTDSMGDANWTDVRLLVQGDPAEFTPVVTAELFSQSAYTPPAVSFKAQDDLSNLFDLQYGGAGRIFGTVKVDSSPDVPVYRRVWLMNQRDAVIIRETWSDEATGEYEFTNIDESQKYSVISFDHTNNFRAVIADSVVPELMS